MIPVKTAETQLDILSSNLSGKNTINLGYVHTAATVNTCYSSSEF